MLYEIVMNEIEEGFRHKGSYGKALVKCQGDEKKAEAPRRFSASSSNRSTSEKGLDFAPAAQSMWASSFILRVAARANMNRRE